MTWLDLVIVALAASRLTRLIVHDSITEPMRVWMWRRWPSRDTEFGDSEVNTDGKDTLGNPIGQLRTGVDVFRTKTAWFATRPRFVGNLISCHWCSGIWVACAVWAVAWFYPVTVPLLAALAVAELIGLLNDRG